MHDTYGNVVLVQGNSSNKYIHTNINLGMIVIPKAHTVVLLLVPNIILPMQQKRKRKIGNNNKQQTTKQKFYSNIDNI